MIMNKLIYALSLAIRNIRQGGTAGIGGLGGTGGPGGLGGGGVYSAAAKAAKFGMGFLLFTFCQFKIIQI